MYTCTVCGIIWYSAVGIGPSTYNSPSIRNLNHKGYVRKQCNKNVYPNCTKDTCTCTSVVSNTHM